MTEHEGHDSLDIVGGDEGAAVRRGRRLGRAGERDGAARADAETQLRELAGGTGNRHDVLAYGRGNEGALDDVGHPFDVVGGDHR